jgi:ATP-dependent phosphofructokinase / diphosphate-dependent phosphofructokinase
MAGNLIVGQSGGPTAVINASLAGVVQAALASSQIDRVLGALDGARGILHEDLVDLRHEDPHMLELLRQTPGAALGTSRLRLGEEHFERVLALFKAHDIRYFCLIGGNDSMDTAHQIEQMAAGEHYELHAIGVPKTVDNDLACTDHCPGYGSAARFVALTIRDTGIDSQSGKSSTPVKIVEIMGRHAGWLTASAALARSTTSGGAPHLIYVPERPVSLDEFLNDIETIYRERGYVVVALSEGVRDAAGHFLGVMDTTIDAFGHQQLGGVSAILAGEVTRRLGLKARFEKPDTMQRSSVALASRVDQAEAFLVGQTAVHAMERGETGKMVTLERAPGPTYHCHTGLVELSKVAGVEKMLPAEFLTSDRRDISDAFIQYANPLIGDPIAPTATLARRVVERALPPWQRSPGQ